MYSSQDSRQPMTPPRQIYTPEHVNNDRAHGAYNDSPTRSYQDYQHDGRIDSPTRLPLTGDAAGTYTGFEMSERKPDRSDRSSKPAWLQEEQKARRKRKWIIISVVLILLVAAATGVTVYLVKFRHSGGGSSPESNSGPSNGRNGYGATAGNLKKDSSLKKIFDGMDYTPLNSQYPQCGSIQANVTADVAILSQLTSRVRLYGTDCDQATMVLDAIQELKVNLTVFVGVWVDNNSTTLNRQLNAMYDILKKYPPSLIEGIAVGNEVLFRQDLTLTQLISLIKEVKANVTAMNLGKSIPICTRYFIFEIF